MEGILACERKVIFTRGPFWKQAWSSLEALVVKRDGDGVSEDRLNRVEREIKGHFKTVSRFKRVARRELGYSPVGAGETPNASR
jgi:hypothetical protein